MWHFCLSLWVKACNFIKKETLAQVLFCEFCKMVRNTFFHRTRLVAASQSKLLFKIKMKLNLNLSLAHCYQAEF